MGLWEELFCLLNGDLHDRSDFAGIAAGAIGINEALDGVGIARELRFAEHEFPKDPADLHI